MDENTGTPIDLDTPNLRAFGARNERLTVTLTTSEGELFAQSTKRVTVEVHEDGSLSLTGTRAQLQSFLRKSATISHFSDDDEEQPELSFQVTKNGEAVTMEDAAGLPTEIYAINDNPADIDFSSVNIRRLVSENTDIAVRLSVGEGTLQASSTNKVTVVTLGGGTIELQGLRNDVHRYLKRLEDITYTAPEGSKGKTKTDLSIEILQNGAPLSVQDVAGVPDLVTVDQAAVDGLDLSSVNLRNFGDRNDMLIVEIQVEDGTLGAESTNRVEVLRISDNPSTIQLIGARKHLQKYLRDIASVTLTDYETAPGENGPYVSMSVINALDEISLASPDEVVLSVINNGIRLTLGDAIGIPKDFSANEDMQNFLDFSELNLRYFAKNRDTITLEIQVNEGTLEADPTSRIAVEGSGTGTLQLTGRRRDIERYLDNVEAVAFTGETDVFGENAAFLTLNAFTPSSTLSLGAAAINIEDAADTRTGTEGDDTIMGDDGQNIILGLGGNDYLVGLGADDDIQGGTGDDDVRGGGGGDVLDGGEGNDVLLYTDSSAGVSVNLNTDPSGFQQASGGDAEGDTISNFEHVYASNFDDTVVGDGNRNILFGYDGNDEISAMGGDDVVRGGGGADTLDGGDGLDWLRYQASDAGVEIDLNVDEGGFQSASGGDAQGDVISNFENVQGSDHGDVIIGNQDANYLIGYAGDDEITAGAGRDTVLGGEGEDILDGGGDTDLLLYTGSSAGVSIYLEADEGGFQKASGGDAEGDVISNFENVYATNFADNMTGDSARNILYGYGGADVLNGGGGDDVLRGGSGADNFVFNSELDGNNEDRILDFESGIDTIVLDDAIFTSLLAGFLSAGNFAANAGGLAQDGDDFVLYDTATGDLLYDADGVGGLDGILFAELSTVPELTNDDFLIA